MREHTEDSYVDDTSLGVDGQDDDVVGKINLAAQQHEQVLCATGGKLSLPKCAWILINWVSDNGSATMATYDQTGTGTGGTHKKLALEQSKTGERVTAPRLNPLQAYRTLGV